MIGTDFNKPPNSKLWVFFFCEICTAINFDNDNIYICYFIDLPTNWSCENPSHLKGTTHVCKTTNRENLANFGFHFDFTLQYDLHEFDKTSEYLHYSITDALFTFKIPTELPQPPYIYFEVVSIDSWGRYRCEGVTYKNLPISQPGTHTYELQCSRLFSQNPIANLRRFFVGDYSSYDDATWFGYPSNHEVTITQHKQFAFPRFRFCFKEPVINKYGVSTIGTGQLNVRMNVVHQSAAFVPNGAGDASSTRQKFVFEKLAASSLIKSVEEVLKAFKKAKKNMMQAKKLA